jgi:N-acetyl-anhydromuramyl-L-alanine amidase AmpD
LDSPSITQRPGPDSLETDDPEAEVEQPPPGTPAITEEPNRTTPSISIVEDYRAGFVHGDKDSAHQKYIVLHDTEGDAGPASVINWWDGNGNLVAAHFIVGRDGTVYQCVPLDKIAHHAGYGDAGHNSAYGITEDGRDDMAGTVSIGSWAPDYGMNAWSVGIEMVHVGRSGPYPEEQLDALDALIAYIDAYYGFESTIIDHKAWRSGNSDTSPEFAEYLANYQNHRQHNG